MVLRRGGFRVLDVVKYTYIYMYMILHFHHLMDSFILFVKNTSHAYYFYYRNL